MAGKSSASAVVHQPRYDVEQVRQYARACGWATVLEQVAGINEELLDPSREHPCPKCGGTTRFRLIDSDAGAVRCNQCFPRGCGDGFASVSWMLGLKFIEAVRAVAEFLGVPPLSPAEVAKALAVHRVQRFVGPSGPASPHAARSGHQAGAGHVSANGHAIHRKQSVDPAEKLKFQEWDTGNISIFNLWAMKKKPITLAAVQAIGARPARYQDRYNVIAMPIYGERYTDAPAVPPVGYCLYNITGGTLPIFALDKKTNRWVHSEDKKIKVTAGSNTPGIIADVARLAAATTIWKVEGPSDLLTLLSLPDLPPDHAVITNGHGANQRPTPWIVELFRGKRAFVVGDADKPGQEGAAEWGKAISTVAESCRLVKLPYEVTENHGKDLRDWALEGNQ
jgi:hypothetical protein